MKAIGIDLGTTNTLAAAGGQVLALPSELDAALLPSVVAFPPSGARVVGTPARRRRAIDGKNTVFSAKRLIGRRWGSPECEELRRRYPFDLVEDAAGNAAFQTRAGTFSPAHIATFVLDQLVDQTGIVAAETRAVIAVPSAFGKAARQQTIAAATGTGFADVVLIDEPLATAHAYAHADPGAIGRGVVYDLGGGTFEVAVVDWASSAPRVLANRADLYLGGDDIDQAIASWVADEILRTRRWDLRDNPLIHDRLVLECERAKIRLCFASDTTIDLSLVDPAMPGESVVTLGQERLRDLTEFLVRRTFLLCDEVLAAAGVKPSGIDAVFLAGGTSQLPMVRRGVMHYFETDPRATLDPMEVVGIGASLWHP